MIRLAALITLVLLTSCREKADESVTYESGVVAETSKNFLFPAGLKEEIEEAYVAFMKTQGPPFDIKTKEELLVQLPREYLDLEVKLTPVASGILTAPTQFILPRGGGAIDLKDYVKGTKGSFFVSFKWAKTTTPDQPLSSIKIFYLSQAKKRKIDDENFGAGCDRYMDVTSFIQSLSPGLKVNATSQRYVSVLAGIYYFVGFEKEKIYLGALKIMDSRHPQIQCFN